MYREEDGLSRICLKPPVPSGIVTFKHCELFSRVPAAILLDEIDDCGRSRQEDLPRLAAMVMGRDKLIDPFPDLTTISDGSADRLLRDSTQRAVEDPKWEVLSHQWTQQGAVFQLCLDIHVDILRGMHG